MQRSAESGNPGHIEPRSNSRLMYRQKLATRIAHWAWAICLFFLLLSGLQIFNASLELYIDNQSGFDFDNTAMSMTAQNTEAIDSNPDIVWGIHAAFLSAPSLWRKIDRRP